MKNDVSLKRSKQKGWTTVIADTLQSTSLNEECYGRYWTFCMSSAFLFERKFPDSNNQE